ncbi:unnamed protein product [Protopolystoma xenopodis]|uniref:Uncharacterized protein n=1 Tax=Protopolystoma xenopodis TaxID=117903 RepID=A0A448WCH6_9PLAT|nr:unnamed protein product [Protopolystoma xenopodis]
MIKLFDPVCATWSYWQEAPEERSSSGVRSMRDNVQSRTVDSVHPQTFRRRRQGYWPVLAPHHQSSKRQGQPTL